MSSNRASSPDTSQLRLQLLQDDASDSTTHMIVIPVGVRRLDDASDDYTVAGIKMVSLPASYTESAWVTYAQHMRDVDWHRAADKVTADVMDHIRDHVRFKVGNITEDEKLTYVFPSDVLTDVHDKVGAVWPADSTFSCDDAGTGRSLAAFKISVVSGAVYQQTRDAMSS